MGLTTGSTGRNAADSGLTIRRLSQRDRVIALAGNPNVGKSTVFNVLTGMNQHTGNWPGKTVSCAQGRYSNSRGDYILVDLPGTYSLAAHSAEEEAARDFLCFGDADAVIVVCDATCLERNLNLVLQALEITSRVVVCVNLLDEARRKGIRVDLKKLEQELGVPVTGASARSGKGLTALMNRVEEVLGREEQPPPIRYIEPIEQAAAMVEPALRPLLKGRLNSRWIALKLLDPDPALEQGLASLLGANLLEQETVRSALEAAWEPLSQAGISRDTLQDKLTACLVLTAEGICLETVSTGSQSEARDRKLDRLLTSKATGIPIMLLLLIVVFWLTIEGANYPSQLLSAGLFWLQDRLTELLRWLHAPEWVNGLFVEGVCRTLFWVVSVMLPPMAIFFPFFTLLEDFGYLPRVAFNLDHLFKKAKTCGKQSLTMCMGLGCNAAGVVGCRIIDSPRERLIAVLTNSFVPCNGRFPTLIAIITMFFAGMTAGPLQSGISALILLGVILLGVLLTFGVSRLLSETLLKGAPSSFALELPPYRKPQIGRVIVRSLFDRTLFVLGRAAAVAAPAGLLLWLLANIQADGSSLLAHCAGFLDPFAQLLGMDGVILLAFILGFPANEIVVPIILMCYLSTGTLADYGSLTELKSLLVENGWTWVTAVSTMLFCLIHWPCSTTCMTIRKETGSWKWTALSVLIPTGIGLLVCFLFTSAVRLLGLG